MLVENIIFEKRILIIQIEYNAKAIVRDV